MELKLKLQMNVSSGVSFSLSIAYYKLTVIVNKPNFILKSLVNENAY